MEFEIDGGISLTPAADEPEFAIALVPNGQFEGHYPDPRPYYLEKNGQFLVDTTFYEVSWQLEERLNQLLDTRVKDISNFRENPIFSPEQKQLLEVNECIKGPHPKSDECKAAIAAVMTGKPHSFAGGEALFNRVFGIPLPYEAWTV